MEFRRGLFRSLPGRRAEEVGRIVQQFVVAAAFNVDLPGVVSRATSSVGEPAIQRALLDFVMALVAVLAVAIIVEWIVRRVLERPRKAVESRSHERPIVRSEEHTSELQSLMRISYAVFCLKQKTTNPTLKSHE